MSLFRYNGTGLDRACCRMESLETFEEILSVLTPKQMGAVALRYEGLNDCEIADLLGITHQAVNSRVNYARLVILRELPHLAPKLEGRTLESSSLVYRRD
jgi:DNA-directed RNA polymerase specialized sigma24 family protein